MSFGVNSIVMFVKFLPHHRNIIKENNRLNIFWSGPLQKRKTTLKALSASIQLSRATPLSFVIVEPISFSKFGPPSIPFSLNFLMVLYHEFFSKYLHSKLQTILYLSFKFFEFYFLGLHLRTFNLGHSVLQCCKTEDIQSATFT